MGVFDRLGDVIKSYLNDDDDRLFKRPRGNSSSGDPDLQAAFDELNDFLNEKAGNRDEDFAGYTKTDHTGNRPGGNDAGASWKNDPPEALRTAFIELGLPPGASAGECKTAYKKLLKLHHPDRHAGHPGNMKKATEKSARINAAYDRIEKWRATGIVT